MGIQNYYSIATHISRDLSKVDYMVRRFRYNQLKMIMSDNGVLGSAYNERYKGCNYKRQFVAGYCLYPIHAVKHKNPMGFSQSICNYTVEGRANIHKNLKINIDTLHYLMKNIPHNHTVELADNRISLYSAQWGKCGITGKELHIGNMELHHKKPTHLGGTDAYRNLIWVTSDVHKLIHATHNDIIQKYLKIVKPNQEITYNINKLREAVGNCVIEQ